MFLEIFDRIEAERGFKRITYLFVHVQWGWVSFLVDAFLLLFVPVVDLTSEFQRSSHDAQTYVDHMWIKFLWLGKNILCQDLEEFLLCEQFLEVQYSLVETLLHVLAQVADDVALADESFLSISRLIRLQFAEHVINQGFIAKDSLTERESD